MPARTFAQRQPELSLPKLSICLCLSISILLSRCPLVSLPGADGNQTRDSDLWFLHDKRLGGGQMVRFGAFPADCQIPLWSLWRLCLELVDCTFRVAYTSNATSMLGLCCSYGCFSGLHYVMLLWFELCACLCMPL
jgi:hypothetical protein